MYHASLLIYLYIFWVFFSIFQSGGMDNIQVAIRVRPLIAK